MHAKLLQSCPALCDPINHSLLCLWDSPDKNTGVDSLSLLQGVFPTQGSNPALSTITRSAGTCLSAPYSLRCWKGKGRTGDTFRKQSPDL